MVVEVMIRLKNIRFSTVSRACGLYMELAAESALIQLDVFDILSFSLVNCCILIYCANEQNERGPLCWRTNGIVWWARSSGIVQELIYPG